VLECATGARRTSVPSDDITPEAEARWRAWLDKGRARDLSRRRKTRKTLLALLFGAIVVTALALGLR
jgi:polyferredoxin